MVEEQQVLNQLLAELQEVIRRGTNPDGTFCLDYCKAKVVLEFAKTEIEKTISG